MFHGYVSHNQMVVTKKIQAIGILGLFYKIIPKWVIACSTWDFWDFVVLQTITNQFPTVVSKVSEFEDRERFA
jgi:hypothetical protein